MNDQDRSKCNTENNSRSPWEQRSRHYGTSLQGVLFKNLPEVINEHIHQWHCHAIYKLLGYKKPQTLLDAGCGYGRLSAAVIERFPGIKTIGLDISPHYVELYQQHLKRPAVAASLKNIPDNIGRFDCILAVTALMYLPQENLLKAAAGLVGHLDNDGALVIIENHCSGRFFQNPFGLKALLKKREEDSSVNTGGRCFRDKDIVDLIQKAGGTLAGRLKMPGTTILILPIYAMAKILPKSFTGFILKMISYLDQLLELLPLPTLHAAYLVTKKI